MGDARIFWKAAIAFTAEEDAIIMDRCGRGLPLSATVRTGRTLDAVQWRYADLKAGRGNRTDARAEGRPATEKRRDKIREGIERSRARRGAKV